MISLDTLSFFCVYIRTLLTGEMAYSAVSGAVKVYHLHRSKEPSMTFPSPV